ncbi:hypothetical protein [Amycolatopsis sp. cmx-4-68]|uniref:hypothetical protein n=1 Tax=Amycolatopsis sp. cmx-4-68 TaxID=2790938 RepID=UPI00397ADE4F
MPEPEATNPAVAGRDPELAPAPMDLTVGEAILAAAELNSGVPAPRAEGEAGSPAASRSGPAGGGKSTARAAKPVSREDDVRPPVRPAADRGGAGRRAGEEAQSHG